MAVADTPPLPHRAAAGEFLHQLLSTWRQTTESRSFTLSGAAVTRDCHCGSWGPTRVLLGEAVDTCEAMLRLAAARAMPYGLIDDSLYEHLQYTYECRQVITRGQGHTQPHQLVGRQHRQEAPSLHPRHAHPAPFPSHTGHRNHRQFRGTPPSNTPMCVNRSTRSTTPLLWFPSPRSQAQLAKWTF